MVLMAPTPTLSHTSCGGRLVARDGRELPLQGVHLAAEAGGGIARVVLTQRFQNPYPQPLEVRYLLPLPADGAVSGFSFLLHDQRIVGEVTGKQAARERFERALVQGRTAALLEQDRSSLFTQRVGNVPPHSEVVVEVTIDQPLRWLEEGAWEWRFPTVVAPRYQGAPGRVPDAGKLRVPVVAAEPQSLGAAEPLDVRATLTLEISDALTGPVSSPSHPVATRGPSGALEVRLEGDQGARLDRDVVVRWPIALPAVSATVRAARPDTAAHEGDSFALFTVAPPSGGWTAVPRDLTFLIDTSGSMSGRPLEQAVRVVAAMIETLGVRDRIEMIEFGMSPRRWQQEPALATESTKQAALKWLRRLRANGGTEMHTAVLEALRPLRPDAQRQVILVTDGLIGFEREIVQALLSGLPGGSRLHTVGVGGATNRSLTQAAARAGRGTEVLIGPEEEVERAVERLLARTCAPLVTDLELTGEALLEVAPCQLPDLYAEAPALLAARLRSGGGEVVLRGRTADGPFERCLQVPALRPGEGPSAVAALFARERVEDLETRLSGGGDPRELNRAIERTGIDFQIATRLTSWIAVSQERTVRPYAQRIEVQQPHELPHGVSAEGLGLRAPGHAARQATPAKSDAFQRASYVDTEEAQRRLGVDEEELRRLVSNAELRAFRDGQDMKFKADDLENLAQGRETEPTLAFGAAEQDRLAPSADELILEDSTSTVINIGDLMGGARASSQQEILFDTTEPLEAPAEAIPTREASSISPDMGLIETDADASLVEAGQGYDEAFELMDEDDERQVRTYTGIAHLRRSPHAARVTQAPRRSRLPGLWLALALLAALLLLALWAGGLFGAGPGSAPPDQPQHHGQRGAPGGVGPR